MQATALRTVVSIRPVPAPMVTSGASLPAVGKCHTSCSSCGLRELCLPSGMSGADLDRLDQLVYTRKRVKRSEALFQAGDEFKFVYAVRSGFFKSSVLLEDGREQVTAFHMPGEIIGLDGIGSDCHNLSVIALDDAEVCIIQFASLELASAEMPALQRQFHKIMSREMVRDHGVMMLLGTMRAEERLATFLLSFSQRFKARGYSSTEFNLRMTREEIGSYLGLKLETVSRIFSRFHDEGLIAVQQKNVHILDVDGLKRVLNQQPLN